MQREPAEWPKRGPIPDQLLAHVQAEEARAKRGRLRIFFGASAGVGKTYAMLEAAHNMRASGTDVVVGLCRTPRPRRDRAPARRSRATARPRRSTIAASSGGSSISTPHWRGIRPSCSSTSSRTRTSSAVSPRRVTRSAGRTSRSCSMPASMSGRPSTSSTWRASTIWSARSRACASARRSPIRSSMKPMRSSSSICRPMICWRACAPARSTSPMRWRLRWSASSARPISWPCASLRCAGSRTASRPPRARFPSIARRARLAGDRVLVAVGPG